MQPFFTGQPAAQIIYRIAAWPPSVRIRPVSQNDPNPADSLPDHHAERARSPITLRSVIIGLLGVIIINLLTPFNDMVLRNGLLASGSLPVGVMLLVFLLVVAINGPMSRFAHSRSLRTGELAFILLLMMVGCAFPGRGLMQFWPAQLTGPWYHSRQEPNFKATFEKLGLPDWYWPSFTEKDPGIDPVVTQYQSRIDPTDKPFWTELGRMLTAFIPPAVGWGIFFAGMFGSILGITLLSARQWIQNERIAFPIAQVQMALVEAPDKGRWLNSTMRSRSFWIGIGVILFLRVLGGLAQYFPRAPEIPLGFNYYALFNDPPLVHLDGVIKSQVIWPLVIAMTFFVSARISFSLWAMILIMQVPLVILKTQGYAPDVHRREANLGALLAFALMILWTGRHHYLRVLRQLVTPARNGEECGLFVHNRTAGWMAIGGATLAIAWLINLNMHPAGAVLLVLSLLLIWTVMAKVVAYCGLLVSTTLAVPHEWFPLGFQNPPTSANFPNMSHVASQWFAQMIGGMWQNNSDSLGQHAANSMKTADESRLRGGGRFLFAIVLAMVLAYGSSLTSHLTWEYTYAGSLDKQPEFPLNADVFNSQPQWGSGYATRVLEKGVVDSRDTLGTRAPVTIGAFILTGLFAVAQLRYAWWPIHPIGLLMCTSRPLGRIWFSIMLGWMIQALIIRFGGPRLYTAAKPFFLGIIIGEVLASGIFLVLAIVLSLMGVPYNVIQFLPMSQY